MFYLYTITNTKNGRKYYGKSCNVERRFIAHLYSLKGNTHPNPELQSDFNKHSIEDFFFGVISEHTDEDECLKIEHEAILSDPDCYNSKRNGAFIPGKPKQNVLKVDNSSRSIFFNRVKAVLAEKGKRQNWLAEETGLHENTISGICTNKNQPGFDALFAIAYVLEVPVCSLLADVKDKDCKAIIESNKTKKGKPNE